MRILRSFSTEKIAQNSGERPFRDQTVRDDRTRSRGVSDPLRTGRRVRHRAEQGGSLTPRLHSRSSIDERHGRHRTPSARDRLRHLQSLDRMTYGYEPPLASKGIG